MKKLLLVACLMAGCSDRGELRIKPNEPPTLDTPSVVSCSWMTLKKTKEASMFEANTRTVYVCDEFIWGEITRVAEWMPALYEALGEQKSLGYFTTAEAAKRGVARAQTLAGR